MSTRSRSRVPSYLFALVVLLIALISFASSVQITAARDSDQVAELPSNGTPTPQPNNNSMEAHPLAVMLVRGRVWDDLDHDGQQDQGEPGLPDVGVWLSNPGSDQKISSQVTNVDGDYSMLVTTPGQYRLAVVLPQYGDQFSPKNLAGGDDTVDSDVNNGGANEGFSDSFAFRSNEVVLDAGIITNPHTVVSGYVWHDLNADGQQDSGEPPLSYVSVYVVSEDDTYPGTTFGIVPSDNGHYAVVIPQAGQYRLRFFLEFVHWDFAKYADIQFSPKDLAGGNDGIDSDVNPGGAHAGDTDVLTIGAGMHTIAHVDAGVMYTDLVAPPTGENVAPLQNPILPQITPSPTQTPPPRVSVNVCGGFRLTSPLDGLPNGMATFYWDPVAVPAGYQVVIMDEARTVLATFSTDGATSVSGDVSQAAIGGDFQLIVQVKAVSGRRILCTDEHVILRAASNSGAPPLVGIPVLPVAPTSTPSRSR